MQNTKYTIPLLALVLLIPLGINVLAAASSADETIDATEPVGVTDENIKPTVRDRIQELSAYEQVMISNNVDLDASSSKEIDTYIDLIREHRNNLLPYQNTFMISLDELARLHLDIKEAQSTNQTTTVLAKEAQYDALIKKLEGWGLTTQENIDTDPSYWMRKAVDFRMGQGTVSETSWLDNHSGMHYVHTGNSALKINSIIWYPCAPGLIYPINCFVVDWGWNIDTVTTTVSPLIMSGTLTFGVDICNERDIDHAKILFDYELDRSITSSLGTTLASAHVEKTASLSGEHTFFNCLSNKNYVSILAGSSAKQAITITDISSSNESHDA